MEEKNILKSVADTFTDEPLYHFRVPVRVVEKPALIKRTWIDKLLRRPAPAQPEPELYRDFTIYPCVSANMVRVAGYAALLPEEIFQDQSENIRLLPEHVPTMIYIIAAAIQNNHLPPDDELIEFLNNNLSGLQINKALFAAFSALEMEAFTDSIVLMRGTVSIINPETSPAEGRSQIASHTVFSDQPANTSDGVSTT